MDTTVIALIGAMFLVLLGFIVFLVYRLMQAEEQQSNPQPAQGSRGSPNTSPDQPRADTGSSAPVESGGSAAGPSADPDELNWLIAQTGGLEGMSFHIGDQVASIGRGFRNYIQVDAETASERHALLMGDLHGLKLTDLGSSNGTALNNDRIEPNVEYELEDGDEFKVGDTIFLYRQQGRYSDDTDKQQKEISTQKKTKAMTAVQGPDNISLKEQVLRAVEKADGDFEEAADQVDLDVDIVKRIVHRAVNK